MIFFLLDLESNKSFSFAFGIIKVEIPASIAASAFAVIPPTARTFPLTDKEPVNAISCLTGIDLKAEIIAVATAIDAESPSTPE